MLKILENWKTLDFEVVKNYNMKWIISRQEVKYQIYHHLSITGLCVYCFYPNLFPFQINIIPPSSNKTAGTPKVIIFEQGLYS